SKSGSHPQRPDRRPWMTGGKVTLSWLLNRDRCGLSVLGPRGGYCPLDAFLNSRPKIGQSPAEPPLVTTRLEELVRQAVPACVARSDGVNVAGFYAADGRSNIELDALPRGGVAIHLDCRVVDEDVLVPVCTGDEAVTLVRVEPLHSSGYRHGPLRSAAVGC